MGKRMGILVGILFVLLGFLMIFNLSGNYFWTITLLVLGLVFEFGFFGKSTGNFIAGGILTTIGMLFLLCCIFGFSILTRLWPIFVVAPGVGLLQGYVFSKRKGMLISSIIIFAVAVLLFQVSFYKATYLRIVLGIILISVGILLALPRKK
ncbi:MAG: hypothetical protein WHT65_03135 [Pseudothermotoga sp.]